VAILITKLQTKREIQTYEKVLYEIRNRHFCQTLVPVAQLPPNIVKDGLFTELKT